MKREIAFYIVTDELAKEFGTSKIKILELILGLIKQGKIPIKTLSVNVDVRDRRTLKIIYRELQHGDSHITVPSKTTPGL